MYTSLCPPSSLFRSLVFNRRTSILTTFLQRLFTIPFLFNRQIGHCFSCIFISSTPSRIPTLYPSSPLQLIISCLPEKTYQISIVFYNLLLFVSYLNLLPSDISAHEADTRNNYNTPSILFGLISDSGKPIPPPLHHSLLYHN